jgi:hydrogenase expression/formation protein HypC
MCLAVPGKVIELKEGKAKVDFHGNIVTADVSLVDAKLGSYVLVHAGYALEVMQEDRAKELMDLLGELEEQMYDGDS